MIKAGDIAEAASCFWRASDRSGSEQEAAGWLKNAAQASEQLSEVEDAVEAWQQMFDTQLAAGITPDLQQMVRVPPLLLQLNRPQQAVNAWAQVAEVHAASAEVKASYAVTLHQLGLLKEAVVLYEQALELKPDLEAAYVNAAMALREGTAPKTQYDVKMQSIASAIVALEDELKVSSYQPLLRAFSAGSGSAGGLDVSRLGKSQSKTPLLDEWVETARRKPDRDAELRKLRAAFGTGPKARRAMRIMVHDIHRAR